MDNYKSIRIKEQTWNRLVALKRGLETFDDVIGKLLEHLQKSKKGV